MSEQQHPGDVPHTPPTPPGPVPTTPPPADDRTATAPQPTGWPSSPWSGAPHDAPPAGAQHTGLPYGTPSYGPAYGPAAHPTATAYAPAAAPRRTGRWRLGVAGLVAGALIGGGAGAGTAVLLNEDGSIAPSQTSGQQVVITDPETATTATAAAAKAAPSVVTIYVSGSSGSGSGSGVVLTEDGYVLTNNHVVAEAGGGAGAVQVRTADGTLYDAEVVGTDPTADVGVVKLSGASGLTPATFADSDEVQVGDVAVAIGAPLGLSNTVTDGIVSATNRAVNLGSTGDDNTVIDAIQTDAAINPGNSGGALVNGAGEVIGINTAIASVAGTQGADQSGNIGVGFAIPGNTAERIATELIEDGEAQRALLGVSATTEGENGSAVGAGARVVSVQSGSPAADAGLQAGDVVTAIDDRPVTSSTELTAAVRSRQPGDTVSLTVRRNGDAQTVEVTLGSTS